MARSTLNISGSEMDNQNRVVQNVHIKKQNKTTTTAHKN